MIRRSVSVAAAMTVAMTALVSAQLTSSAAQARPATAVVTAPGLALTRTIELKWHAASGNYANDATLAGFEIAARVLPSKAWGLGGTASASQTSLSISNHAGKTMQLAVNAHDKSGHFSTNSNIVTVTWPYDQNAATYGGRWTMVTDSAAYLGSVRRTSAVNASATMRGSGKTFGIVVSQGPHDGKLAVYVDGVQQLVVDTYASTTAHMHYVVVRTFSTVSTHTIKIVNLATAGRPTINLDGIVAKLA